MRYGIKEKNGWYSDFKNGLLDNGDPFPSIFLSEKDAHDRARIEGLKEYTVALINVRDYCDLLLEEGSGICRYCDCHKTHSIFT